MSLLTRQLRGLSVSLLTRQLRGLPVSLLTRDRLVKRQKLEKWLPYSIEACIDGQWRFAARLEF